MNLRTFCTTTIAALTLLTLPTVAQADPILSLDFPLTSYKILNVDPTDHGIASADVNLSFLNDPVYSFSAPIGTFQLSGLPLGSVPLFSFFDMPEIHPTSFVVDPLTQTVHAEYGNGSFSIGVLTTPLLPVLPWLTATFQSATLTANLMTGTGTFFGIADLSGLLLGSGVVEGSFSFALGPQDLANLQLQYQMAPGVNTTPVPEPGTILLFAIGLGMAAVWKRRAALALSRLR